MSSTDVKINETLKVTVKEPKRYHVVMLNDNKTTFDFVIGVLMSVFRHSKEGAVVLAEKIHTETQAIVGTYTFEIAEQKTAEVIKLARDAGFPLKLKIETD
jgi:ATP-dependent Clp protease adaptor protein ClpS